MIDFANQVYMNSQFAVVLGFFFWVYFFRNDAYYFIRNMFMVSMGLALVGYTLYPTAPPRLFPQYGFVDTINDFSSVNHDSALAKLFINPYAAVPSMHCAFAAMIGFSGARSGAAPRHACVLDRLAAAGRLGRRRHRQPLLGRRGAGLDGRRDRGAGRPAPARPRPSARLGLALRPRPAGGGGLTSRPRAR